MNPEAYLIGIGLRTTIEARRMTQWEHNVQWYAVAMIWMMAYVVL
jgi:hypothetical protein